jgi:FtsP/CotA-like multicopper oxidase with cupredoxin domain
MINRRNLGKSLLALPLLGTSSRAAAALDLKAVSRSIEVNGKAASVFGLVGPDGKPGLSLAADALHEVMLTNTLTQDTLIHWHGLTPQWAFDGVPDMPKPLLKPAESRSYQLPGGRSGTHWMHAHTLQEQNLLAAPLIVRSKDDLARDEQEIVVLLHDFSFTPAEELLKSLGAGGGMTHGAMDHSKMAGGMKMGDGMMMGGGMMGMDVNDITYDAYLANDRTLADPEVHAVEKGGRVRLRIINGATSTAFTLDTGALEAQVVAVDGQDVQPLLMRLVPLAMGQRVDLILTIPKEGGAFPVLALREGAVERTGFILATAGAAVSKLAGTSEAQGPLLDLAIEARLVSLRPLAEAAVARRFTVMLHGTMQPYVWAMMTDRDLRVAQGERVEVEMQNHSMMTHPMHLHGHHFEIVAINGQRMKGAVRDTVVVPPMNSVTFGFDANNPGGGWAFHCHHLYHMATGMMSSIAYEGA